MGPHLLVFGDSLCFHGPEGPCAADEPRLWPNVTANALSGRADLVAGIGWTARDLWWSLTGDPRVWADLHRVDAVVLAVGSMDTLPSPLPTYLRQGLRYVRPERVRHVIRGAYLAAQPKLSIALRGRPRVLPAHLTVSFLDQSIEALRALRPELPVFGMVPSVHRADAYGRVHTGRAAAVASLTSWAAQREVPLVDTPGAIGEHVLSGAGNPDGMHWGWAGHEVFGTAMAKLIAPYVGAGNVG
ncbi:GDSL-like lipase/acylhydrolase family protein [Amycolatopsis sulphurea]|uniref:GDSL-like lipase/acylhydrolase family protein n=1 Tax=Amycolatopsis sulphurea TaxID=76022 RepID=A0A2A9FHW8_9PSEU|nr:diglucosylglycerate octanoyltransferase [Amycolatopsis sulphurea]PFG50346.1 GDSL-like lipase/acylhydrolase family protein [Amycolatopsis sulphurea]